MLFVYIRKDKFQSSKKFVYLHALKPGRSGGSFMIIEVQQIHKSRQKHLCLAKDKPSRPGSVVGPVLFKRRFPGWGNGIEIPLPHQVLTLLQTQSAPNTIPCLEIAAAGRFSPSTCHSKLTTIQLHTKHVQTSIAGPEVLYAIFLDQ